MSFRATVRADQLDALLDPVNELVTECVIHLDPDGLTTRAIDPANVGMVDASLGAAVFESYEVDGGQIGVNLSRLTDVVGIADSGDLVHLDLDAEARKLHISIGGLEYTLALIDPDTIRGKADNPDLDLPTHVVIEGRQLDRAVTAADMVADHLSVGVDLEEGDEHLEFEAHGDTDDVHIKLDADDLIDSTFGPAKSLFSLDYLKSMNRAIPKDAEVRLELGEEYPMKMHFDIADGHGAVIYMLAPRIQSGGGA